MDIKAIEKYICKKAKMFAVDYQDPTSWEDSLYTNLEVAAMRLAKTKIDFEIYVPTNIYHISDTCWRHKAEYWAEETAIGRNNPGIRYGLYVHMTNSFDPNKDDFVRYAKNVMEITGEICVSDPGDYQFARTWHKLGLVLRGTPTARFHCDCYSDTLSDGTRYATRTGEYDHRCESWIIPDNCELVAVVCADSQVKHFQYLEQKLGVPVIKLSTCEDGEQSLSDAINGIDNADDDYWWSVQDQLELA